MDIGQWVHKFEFDEQPCCLNELELEESIHALGGFSDRPIVEEEEP
jgi:hypothetical protein